MSDIVAVIFDLDGVLVDACDWHYQALNMALREVACTEISEQEHITTYNGLPTKTKLSILTSEGKVSRKQWDDIYRMKQEFTEHVIEQNVVPMPEKIELHKKLHIKGVAIGCVTNAIRRSTEMMLELSGQEEFMDVIISNQDVKRPKPHPEGYIKAMVLLQSPPENTLIVEDSPKGLQAAQATGALVVQVRDATEVTWGLLKEYVECKS